jgi:predicted DNA-binding transcriptional regulator
MMARHNKIDVEKFEQDVYRELTKGNNTISSIAHSLKISNAAAKLRLARMYTENKLTRKIVSQVTYYSKCYLPANDPFNLTGKTYD